MIQFVGNVKAFIALRWQRQEGEDGSPLVRRPHNPAENASSRAQYQFLLSGSLEKVWGRLGEMGRNVQKEVEKGNDELSELR